MGKRVKISLHDKYATKEEVLGGYGIAILDNVCIKCESNQTLDNGDYTLDCTFLLDKEGKYKLIEKEMILKVLIDGKPEVFRIVSIVATNRDLQVFARQITIELTLGMHLGDVRPTNLSGLASLLYLKENSNEYKEGKQYAKDLEVFSDLTTTNTAYYNELNLYKALHDCDQSFSNRWGGEVLREGYRLNILQRVGEDRGFQVRSRKNLLGFEANTSLTGVTTIVKPKGFDGITIDGYVISPIADRYVESKTKVIEYSDVKVRNDNTSENEEGMIFDTLEEAQAELIKRANLEFSKNHIDEPTATYNVSFVPLEQTEEYKNYSVLEKCRLGDTVHVFEEKHNINIEVRCKSIKYNILTQRIVEIGLSNQNLSKSISSIENIIKKLETIPDENGLLNEAKKQASDLLNNGVKQGYFVWDTNGWAIMDTKDKNTAQEGIKATKEGIGLFKNGYYGELISAITSRGIVADTINTGVLSAILIQSDNGATTIDLNSGVFKSKQGDGSEIIISPTEGFYNKFGNSKREYYHLNYYDIKNINVNNDGTWESSFTLPSEFKGKKFIVDCNYKEILSSYPLTMFGNQRIYQEVDYTNGIIKLSGTVFPLCVEFYTSGSQTYLMQHKGNKTVTVKISINVIA
ncbi:MAG: phage tail spike protein [Clostridium sp.]|uniref:phage tail spike protein n=2 Tax=Clostridium sp. TaxID=1506 RepID=UPI0028FEB124|nr:phage tail spike protein [Clostridium sp.]MDU1125131.1 phage tail spike protein [Clostridium sp.]MDU3676202.1 phage tail spike protein [Clostridium sp.]MDU6874044.1 phage tail spike protein [Clostridium sp.]MDU6935071.1 phage tail spike protein [Clostridium sp.]